MKMTSAVNQMIREYNVSSTKTSLVNGVEYRWVFMLNSEGMKATLFGLGDNLSNISFEQGFFFCKYEIREKGDFLHALKDFTKEIAAFA